MGKPWLIVTTIAGIVAAPYITDGIDRIIEDPPNWFPYFFTLIVTLVAGLGGEYTRGFAVGLIVSLVVFAALVSYSPETVEFLGTRVAPPL